MMRSRYALIFLALAFFTFVISTVVYDIVARTSIGGETITAAFQAHIRYMGLGSLLLLLPYVLLAWMCIALAGRGKSLVAFSLLVLGYIPMSWLYYEGYQASQAALIHKKWTASALSLGLLPFQAALILLLILVPWGLLMRCARPEKPNNALQATREDARA